MSLKTGSDTKSSWLPLITERRERPDVCRTLPTWGVERKSQLYHSRTSPVMMSEFTQHMSDVFRLFGPITLRRVFAGHGFFPDGIMFGLVCDETLYLKVDTENVEGFQRKSTL